MFILLEANFKSKEIYIIRKTVFDPTSNSKCKNRWKRKNQIFHPKFHFKKIRVWKSLWNDWLLQYTTWQIFVIENNFNFIIWFAKNLTFDSGLDRSK